MKNWLCCVFLLGSLGCAQTLDPKSPTPAPTSNVPTGRIDAASVKESSGLVESGRTPGVFWTLNDSGNPPLIFPMLETGKVLNSKGVRVEGVTNQDWESLGRAPDGRLMVGAFGNNNNARRNLAVLLFEEPTTNAATVASAKVERVNFRFPDQTLFPPPPTEKAFDCEAVYTHRGRVYVLSKDRGPKKEARLYRFRDLVPREEPQVLEKLGAFGFGEMVTGADARGDRLAVLTYDAIWLVALGEDGAFGKRERIPFLGLQCEATAWLDDERVMITNEQRDVFVERVVGPASSVE